MSDESVQVIRESTRKILKFSRQIHRDDQLDVGRNIAQNKVTSEEVADIVNKLKFKSSITPSCLHLLKNSIIDDSKNVELVLKNHGALRGLVREITGRDVRRQVAAAGCCCNLALGDSKECIVIAKAAGSYLVAALDNPSTEMAVTCAWTLGNIAGSGRKACDVLVAQGALSKLIDMLSRSNNEVSDAAVYAVLHFAYHMNDCLSKDQLHRITEAYSKLKASMTSYQLLFVLSCNSEFSLNSQHLLVKLLDDTMVSIQKHCDECKCHMSLCCELVYLLRILANTCDTETSCVILNYFESKIGGERLKHILCSDNNIITESLIWFLGNMYSCCGDSNFYNLLLSN